MAGLESSGASTPSNRKTKICVYCGSSPGNKPEYLEAARQLARVMAANNIGLGEPPPHSHFPSPFLCLRVDRVSNNTTSIQSTEAAQSASWAR